MSTWVKLYNSMPQNPKVLSAGDRAAWLYVCGLCYANEHLTDGFIPAAALPVVAPNVKRADKLAPALVASGLWHPVEGGWKVHDYGDFQRSSNEIRKARAADSARKAAARSGRSPTNVQADSARTPPGFRGESAPLEESREREEKRTPLVTTTSLLGGGDVELEHRVIRLCALMSTEVRAAHGISGKSTRALPCKPWHDACRAMLTLDGYSVEQVEYAIRWVCRHHIWRWRIRSMTRLRSEMEQVVSEIKAQRQGATVTPIGRKENASDLLRRLPASDNTIEGTAS